MFNVRVTRTCSTHVRVTRLDQRNQKQLSNIHPSVQASLSATVCVAARAPRRGPHTPTQASTRRSPADQRAALRLALLTRRCHGRLERLELTHVLLAVAVVEFELLQLLLLHHPHQLLPDIELHQVGLEAILLHLQHLPVDDPQPEREQDARHDAVVDQVDRVGRRDGLTCGDDERGGDEDVELHEHRHRAPTHNHSTRTGTQAHVGGYASARLCMHVSVRFLRTRACETVRPCMRACGQTHQMPQ